MKRFSVQTGWTGNGKTLATAFKPAIATEHKLTSFIDKSGANPRLGGVFTIECTCDDDELVKIQANPRYAGKVTVH
jgi:hypothetical protein